MWPAISHCLILYQRKFRLNIFNLRLAWLLYNDRVLWSHEFWLTIVVASSKADLIGFQKNLIIFKRVDELSIFWFDLFQNLIFHRFNG